MPLYTFYLRGPDGVSTAFEAFELRADEDTTAHADLLMAQHPSCDHVDVWCDDRAVLTLHRDQRAIRSMRA